MLRKLILFSFLFISAHIMYAGSLNSKFQLLPTPQKVDVKNNGSYLWSDVVCIYGDTIPVLGPLLDALPQTNTGKGVGVKLQITDQGVPTSDEGYTLQIGRREIVIKSRSARGLFYGCTTLEQLLGDSKLWNINLPELNITDYPSIDFRSVHLDTKHHLDRTEYYYSMIDRLSKYKINAIIWEIEDKLKFTRRPEVAAPNALSKQEMQALSRYAKERNIEINPLVQGLGHAGFILKHHWDLRENPKSDWEFCPSDERTYELQFDLYRDAMDALPDGKYLHIGGDEITQIGIDDRCKKTGKTPFELQMYWLQRVCDFAIANGRTPIFWDDMPLKYANVWSFFHSKLSDEEIERTWKADKLDEAIELFPKDCIYMRWHYADPTILQHVKVLNWYKNKGLNVMGATAAADGGCPFMPRNDSRAHNIKSFSKLVVENNLVGILATAWDDGSPHLETVMRGFIAQGEYGWNPTAKEVDQFKKAHAQREYGLVKNEMAFLDKLEEQAFNFDGLLISAGRRNPSWQVVNYTLIDLPNKQEPGAWSAKYADKINTAKEMVVMHESIAKGLNDARNHARGNRYTFDVYEQNNELFNYPALLVLALHQYDVATTDAARAEAAQNIKDVCQYLEVMKTNLENVYSKTRFLVQPEGYIADHNHHNHLSALTLNNDWLYLYEIPYTQRVSNWINK